MGLLLQKGCKWLKLNARGMRTSLLHQSICLLLLSATYALIFCPVTATADEVTATDINLDANVTADLVKVSTPNYISDIKQFKPKLGVFNYEAAWQGIPAADVSVEVDTDGLHYFVNVSARTLSAIDIFYRMRYEANGVLSAPDFLPMKSTYDQKENSRAKITEITYMDSGEVRSYRKREGKDAETMQFNPNNIMLDPFSSIFLARALDWKLGDVRKFDVFNGKSRYLITLSAIDKTKIDVNGVMKDVWVISPTVDNLTSKKANKKLREARIYVTADTDRDIVKIASSVFIGEVTATLTAFTPSGPAAGTAMAQTQQNVFRK